jgi:hypothetical protein
VLLLALDTATVTGFAIGEPGSIPRSGSVRLKKPSEHRDVAPFNAYCFLRDMWTLEKPDLVVVEHFMSPAAQKSADAIILQIEVYGVVVALCRAYGIRYEAPQRMTVVKHFIGEQRRQDRAALKARIVARAVTLGYMPRGCADQNRADACSLFDYGAAHYCRMPPKSLVLFGEQSADAS